MKTKRIGLIIFWAAAVFMFGFAYLASWWITPMYRYTPMEVINQGPWAYMGFLMILWWVAFPLGAVAAIIGMIMYSKGEKLLSRVILFVIVGIAIVISLMVFGEIAYYPTAFGVAGGLIVVFAIITFLYWGKSREALEGRARLAADFRAIGYLLLIVNSYALVCSLLGSPFSGLYFPEKVIAEGTLPIAYSQGLKSAYYFAGSFIFFFLASYLEAKENRQKKAM